eukprot:g39228.t1
MAHAKPKANDGKITYPPGVKEISDKISKEEMVRRLKLTVKKLIYATNFGVIRKLTKHAFYVCIKITYVNDKQKWIQPRSLRNIT